MTSTMTPAERRARAAADATQGDLDVLVADQNSGARMTPRIEPAAAGAGATDAEAPSPATPEVASPAIGDESFTASAADQAASSPSRPSPATSTEAAFVAPRGDGVMPPVYAGLPTVRFPVRLRFTREFAGHDGHVAGYELRGGITVERLERREANRLAAAGFGGLVDIATGCEISPFAEGHNYAVDPASAFWVRGLPLPEGYVEDDVPMPSEAVAPGPKLPAPPPTPTATIDPAKILEGVARRKGARTLRQACIDRGLATPRATSELVAVLVAAGITSHEAAAL